MDKEKGFRETKMIYVFDYLPAGLFNRAQVFSVTVFLQFVCVCVCVYMCVCVCVCVCVKCIYVCKCVDIYR